MDMETVMGGEAGARGRRGSDPLNTDIIFQKHKPKTEQYIFGVNQPPQLY